MPQLAATHNARTTHTQTHTHTHTHTHTIIMNAVGCGEQNTLTNLTSLKIIITRNIESVCNRVENLSFCCQVPIFGDPLPRLFKPSWFVKNMAARGRGIFSLYIYIEKFKNLLLRYHWIEFNVTWQECCFGDPLPRLFTPSWYVKKYGRQGAGLIFPYVYIENFKILLVRNHLTGFNITWQECCFGDPLPRLFKQSWFIKKHSC